MQTESFDVFVSYARVDGRHAADIDSLLRARGLTSFFDRRNLQPGLPWVRVLEKALNAAKAAVILIGAEGLGNTQQYERDLAIIRQSREPSFPIVPVILPGAQADRPFNFLQVLTWIDFSHVAKVSDAPADFDHLVAAIRGGQTSSADAVREAICPYRGLDAFREEDSAFFFGRGSADDAGSPIGQLVRKVRDYPFVMVVGRSGSGKSSLVYAGLLPALRRKRDRFWNVLTLRPSAEPLEALATTFNRQAEDEGSVKYAAKIGAEAQQLRTGDPELLSRMIRRELGRAEGQPDRLLLYIDQWEELYAQAPSPSVDNDRTARHAADVNRFIDLLLNASQSAPVSVVATIRADFYDPLISHQEIRALLPTQQVLLGAMSRAELESTIVEPAKIVGLTFDPPQLVSRILDEAGEEGMLPLLQYALKETWTLCEGRVMTGDSYARSGGVREAIRLTAERTFEDLSPDDQQAARKLFLRLVTPGEGQEDTRARATMPTEPALRRIVDRFSDPHTRLLVTGSDRVARPTVEVAHEALIRTWPRLRKWIDLNREKLRARTAILQAKTDWEQNRRRDDMLLPAGLQLERARNLLTDHGDIGTDDIREFISLSSAREEAERKEREEALKREKAQVAEIKAAQARTADAQARIASSQRITRWAFAAVAALILTGGGIGEWLQADKAQKLAALSESLNGRQVELDHARANILSELSGTKLLRGEIDSALRLAAHGARIDLGLPGDITRSSRAAAALAAATSQANWRLGLGGHDGSVYSAAFSPDGSRIVTASSDKTARIWDAATATEIAVLRGHEDSVQSAAFSPDGSRIVTASSDKTARIWDAATATEIAVLRGHKAPVYSAAFSPDGLRIVTASLDETARIWDAATAKEVAVLGHGRVGALSAVVSAAFSPDGSRVVTAGDGTHVWDAAAAKEIAVLRDYDGEVVNSAAFSPDGSRIVTAGTADKTVRIWDAATAKEIAVLRGHEGAVVSAAFSPDGLRIVTASLDETARIWDSAAAKEIAVLRDHDSEAVNSAAFSPDGSRIVTASSDTTARIWDAATANKIAVLRGHEGEVRSAAFSPDGSRIVTASSDKTARIWDAATATEIAVLRGHEGALRSAAFSPDGSRIITGSEEERQTTRIWDVATAKQVAVLGHEHYTYSVAFSPDGSRIVTASQDYTARIWDGATTKEIAVLRHEHLFVFSAAFSPDGLRIVTASWGGSGDTAPIWDAATATEIAVLRGHEGIVLSAAFSPDGSRIVTASVDKTARIWDTATAKEIAVLRGHEGSVQSAAFSPDGSRIVTASSDKTARIWDSHLETMSVQDLLVEACVRLAGVTKLTREEMRLAGHPDSMSAIDICISNR